MENSSIFKTLFSTTHAPINVYFSKNSNDFVVREIPIYEFSGTGEHLILEIQKKGLTTHEAISILSRHSGAKVRDFGYAGLKDKEGMTTQFISMPAKFKASLENFNADGIKILNSTLHNNKIRLGHLKGNSFFIRLKKVLPHEAVKLQSALKSIDENGYPNYFGYQRFGKFGDNAKSGFDLLNNKSDMKLNPKMRNFLLSAYQSDLFNKWLSKRVEISHFARDFSIKELKEIYKFDDETSKEIKSQKQFFKLIKGEVLGHYPYGKIFLCENLSEELEKFILRDRTSCGLLLGSKAFKSSGFAKILEDEIFNEALEFEEIMNGSRRFAWAWLENLDFKYKQDIAQFNISFTLQKGSYATVVLKEILRKDLFE